MATMAPEDDRFLVLDTDVFTQWRGGNPYVRSRVAEYVARHKRAPALTSFVVFEAFYGIEWEAVKKREPERRVSYAGAVEAFVSQLDILPFEETAARHAAYLLAQLGRSEGNRMWNDVFIAATALAHGFGIASNNVRDFAKIGEVLPEEEDPLRLVRWKL